MCGLDQFSQTQSHIWSPHQQKENTTHISSLAESFLGTILRCFQTLLVMQRIEKRLTKDFHFSSVCEESESPRMLQ